jgi:hypothetical protein
MFSRIVTQLLELQIPLFLLLVLEIEIETDFVEPSVSLEIHYANFEGMTLILDPIGQLLVFLEAFWHFTCNTGRATGGVLVGVFKMKVKWSTAKNNSQSPCFSL